MAQDRQFIYLETQAATFGLGYVIEGPLYIYKADPKTLQPVGATDFINTGLEYNSPPSLIPSAPSQRAHMSSPVAPMPQRVPFAPHRSAKRFSSPPPD